MIETVRFQNYKGFEDVEVKLERLTVFVGPNASGKTSVLSGIESISHSKEVNPDTVFFSRSNFNPYYIYKRRARAKMVLSWTGPSGGVCVTAIPPKDYDSINVTLYKGEPQGFEVTVERRDSTNGKWIKAPSFLAESRLAGRTPSPSLMLRLEGARLAAPSVVQDPLVRMKSDGTGLASVLANLALSDPDLFLEIQHHVARVIPTVQRIRFARSVVAVLEEEVIRVDHESMTRKVTRQMTEEKLLFDMKGAPSLPVESVSEGTLFIVGLITVLYGPDRPKLLLIDDLDHALHPRAQRELVKLLRELLAADPELQIVATTHSPYLLDALKPEEVRFTTRRDDGSCVCGALVDHPDFERWKEEMAPGEMWSVFGEDWVAKLHPLGK